MAVTPDKVVNIASSQDVKAFLDEIGDLSTSTPALFFDLEGVKLSRHGSISLMLINVPPRSTVYMIDVHSLGAAAFSAANNRQSTLKKVLESPSIAKVCFDVRNDSDALFSHYGIELQGIQDLQLMELASRKGNKSRVNGLARCIEQDLKLPPGDKAKWQASKDTGHRLFDPAKGGSYEVFNERPLKPEIAGYCVGDVAMLPRLFDIYHNRLRPANQAFRRSEVQKATEDRVKASQAASYQPWGPKKGLSPWGRRCNSEGI